MEKSLEEKAIDFKGKKYVLVADRVIYFNETYPKGGITTELISPVDSNTIIVKATVKPELDGRTFTGYSQAVKGQGHINTTSALENAETSAVGRALAFMGIGVIESIASVDEINKAEAQSTVSAPKTPVTSKSSPVVDNSLPFGGVEICQVHNTEFVPGKNGKPYCKKCYIEWAESKKKS